MNKQEQYTADSQEKSKQFAIEQVRKFLPNLRNFHDLFEDRSIMADKDVADYIARQFSSDGVEVFFDFAKDLKEAKTRQAEESK